MNQIEKQLSNPELRETVQVFCRLSPLPDETELPSIKLLSPTTLAISSDIKTKTPRKECNYVFRHVFTSYSGQREVFEHVALPLLEDLVNGKNGLLFTYGVTGSGKTHTLNGDSTNPGIMPSCINTLFNSISELQAQKFRIKSDRMNGFEILSENEALEERFLEAKSSVKRLRTVKKAAGEKLMYSNDGIKLRTVSENCLYAVFISYTEIYNNAVYDLLDESNNKTFQARIIREDSRKNMYVNGVEEVEVKSAADAFELISLGQKRKRMAHTLLNSESSRSHSIFNIRVVQLVQSQDIIPSHNLIKVGQLSLVDLAGSERCNRTNNVGVRLKEASSINNSLMTLRTCMETLRENQVNGANRIVPYRDSRLTLLFKNYFEGEGQVRMIVCIKPSEQDCEENLQVLKFAEVTQDVQVTKAEPRYFQQFKTPTIKAGAVAKTKSRIVPSLSFGPKIPSIKLNLEEAEKNKVILDKLAQVLRARKQKSFSSKNEFERSVKHFRKRLTDFNQETVISKSEVRSLKATLKKERILSQNLNIRINDYENLIQEYVTKNTEQEQLIQNLQLTIDEKNLKINQNCLEKEKSKQKFALHAEKLNQEHRDKLRQQRQELQIGMQARDLKLQKMKELIDSDVNVILTPTRPEITVISQSDKELKENVPYVCETGNERSSVVSSVINNNKVSRVRPGAREVWLEHNSIKPVPLQTVLQPSMKRRKSVDKLKKATDITNPKQSKYCLIAQESDGAGDVETKLYKGDIVPTCGGGAQVIFNGIECLHEESPTKMPLSPSNK